MRILKCAVVTDFSSETFQAVRKKYSLRRSDRYTALVLAAAGGVLDAVPDVSGDTGVIVASSFGPHRTTCAFLDDLLDYREEDVMPTTFSHSVHNAAASYAASAFGLRGPEFTLTGFENLFYEALRTAELCGALCSRMLVVSVEENALMTEEIANHVCRIPPEGAAAFLVSPGESGNGLIFQEDAPELTLFELAERIRNNQLPVYIGKGKRI